MAKILGHGGSSVAGNYDVEGSQIGIKDLRSDAVHLVHDMAGQLWNERVGCNILRLFPGTRSQSQSWLTELVGGIDISEGVHRIIGVCIITDDESRLTRAQLSIGNAVAGAEREIPIFCWDSAVDTHRTIRMVDNGGAVNNFDYLIPTGFAGVQPSIMWGREYNASCPNLLFRGATLAFGAGTVDPICRVYIAGPTDFPSASSLGLPVPSW